MNNLHIVLILSLIPSLYFAFKTKDLPFFLPNLKTDNEKMLAAASKINFLEWPSKIHTLKNFGVPTRCQCREYWAIICSIFLKIFKNSKNDHITILVGLFSNFCSTILIYLIFLHYFNDNIALIASLIYLTSFWIFHIILFIGHIVLSQMFFLLSVFFIQITSDQPLIYQLISFLFAGSFTFISFHSSSASMKYPPLSIAAFLFAIEKEFSINLNFFELDTLLILITIVFSLIITKAFVFKKKEEIFKKLLFFLLIFNLIFLLILCYFSITKLGLLKITFFLLGLVIIFLHITLPAKTFFNNVRRAIAWRGNISFISHFIGFSHLPIEDQVKIFNKPMPRDFSGGDWFWNLKTFNIFMPFVFPIYIISVLIFFISSIQDFLIFNHIASLINFIILFFISILPTIIHEFTRGLKVAKAYFPTFLSFLFFIFSFIHFFENKINIQIIYNFFYFICILQFIHSLYILKDTLDSRIYVKKLYNFLIKNKIFEFYTYNNIYNENFVTNMISSFPNKFKIHFINNIEELKNKPNKIVVIPPITSKAFFLSTDTNAQINGFFNEDKVLLNLIETKEIEKYSLKKFKTMSSYKYYIYDDEVLSYISIYLKKITSQDRYKGFAWVLNLNKLWT